MISLSRTGCIEYASEMYSRLSDRSPILLCSNASKNYFERFDEAIETYTGKKNFALNSVKFYNQCKSRIERYKNQYPSLVIYFPVFHPWNLIIARRARLLNIPVVSTVHDFQTHVGEKSRTVELIQSRIIKLSNRIIFLTQSEKQKAIAEIPSISEKAFVLAHPLLNVTKKSSLDHSLPLSILFLGRLKSYKGYQFLNKIANKLSGNKITIAGSGETMVPIASNINFVNKYLSETEISDLIQTHHVLVLPYLEATQSGVMTIGINAEMAMIISDLPGLREQLDNRSAIWIDNNPKALLNAIKDLESNRENYYQLKENLILFKDNFEEQWIKELQKVFS